MMDVLGDLESQYLQGLSRASVLHQQPIVTDGISNEIKGVKFDNFKG